MTQQTKPTVVDATCAACPEIGTYRLTAHCTNCDWRGEVRFTDGHSKDTTTCPQCKCKRKVYAGEFAGKDRSA